MLTLVYHGIIYSKKNSKRIITNRRTGKPQIVSNRNAKEQEWLMALGFRRQALMQNGCMYDERSVCELKFDINVAMWQPDERKRDLDNQLTSILDGLVAAGVIPDDSNKYVTRLKVTNMGVDKKDPRAEIYIGLLFGGEE